MSDWATTYQTAAAGDVEARERLLSPLLGPLRAYIRIQAGPLLRAHESVSDLVQSVCREILQDLSKLQLEHEAAFRRWALKTAERKLADRVRRIKAQKRAVEQAKELASWSELDGATAVLYKRFVSPPEAAITAEAQRSLEAAMQALPGPQRRVIFLTRILDLPHAEAARILGKTEGATRVLLMRSLSRLAKELDKR